MKMKKIWGFVAALALFVNALGINGFANGDTDQILAKKYNELTKAKFDTYNYKFQHSVGDDGVTIDLSKLDFEDGVIGGKIDDFDNDSENELLVFVADCDVNSDSRDFDDITNSIEANIYEVVNGEAVLAGGSDKVYGAFYGDSGGTECFIKSVDNKKYIVIQNTYEGTVASDGGFFDVLVLEYADNSLNKVFEFEGAGSAINYSPDEIADFKTYGFINTYNHFGVDEETGESNYYISPYFNSFNVANIEDNVEKIVEVLITNNAETYYDTNIDYYEAAKNMFENGSMEVSINNSTNIQVSNDITVILNGENLSFEEKPYIENGTTRVPMRAIFEALGAVVDYEANTKTITASKDGTTIELVTGATTAKINGNTVTLSASVENKNGYTMVPLRFVSEALGAEVNWNGESRVITINL